MKLTTKSEYSILALIYIAKNQNSAYVKIYDICSYYDIPAKYLEQLLLILKQSRYIKSKRGANGGYRLVKDVGEISIAEIVRLMDGALAPTESASEYFYSKTPIEKEQKIIDLFKKIRNYIANLLEKTTLKDLL